MNCLQYFTLSFGGGGPANVLTVCADTSAQPASRWYAGAGIYRHVRLVVTDPVHLAADGVFVTTPKISSAETTVQVEVAITNESSVSHEISVQTSLLAPDGSPVGSIESSQTIDGGATAALAQPIVFATPQLWSLNEPNLYRAITRVNVDGKPADEQATTFGIRDAHFEADTGFWLNGKNFKIKGFVCTPMAARSARPCPFRFGKRV